jgi:hypothetical protein
MYIHQASTTVMQQMSAYLEYLEAAGYARPGLEVEERHTVLDYVLTTLNRDLFKELLEAFFVETEKGPVYI